MADQPDWLSACTREVLVSRARLYAEIRAFFNLRGVLEVETPLLCRGTVTDPMLAAFKSGYTPAGGLPQIPLFLQTSPEFAMKRMVASGAGSIYQISKAFRNGEIGRHHNPEFTLLEWYRVGFGLDQLQDEIEALFLRIAAIFERPLYVDRTTYEELFSHHLGIHPLEASMDKLMLLAELSGLNDAKDLCGQNRGYWLDFLFNCLIQPKLPGSCLTMVSRYPALLPSLARKSKDDARWVERVELFLGGMELGNGFHELTDPVEQEQRFHHDLEARRQEGLELPELDMRLLEALRSGLPDCAGIAVGLDRLLMAMMGADHIENVLAFPFPRA